MQLTGGSTQATMHDAAKRIAEEICMNDALTADQLRCLANTAVSP